MLALTFLSGSALHRVPFPCLCDSVRANPERLRLQNPHFLTYPQIHPQTRASDARESVVSAPVAPESADSPVGCESRPAFMALRRVWLDLQLHGQDLCYAHCPRHCGPDYPRRSSLGNEGDCDPWQRVSWYPDMIRMQAPADCRAPPARIANLQARGGSDMIWGDSPHVGQGRPQLLKWPMSGSALFNRTYPRTLLFRFGSRTRISPS